LRRGRDAHDSRADDERSYVLRDRTDYRAEYAESCAPDEDPASSKDVGDAADNGEGYGGGESVTEGDPDDVGVLEGVSDVLEVL
jgi:hypothetical protein